MLNNRSISPLKLKKVQTDTEISQAEEQGSVFAKEVAAGNAEADIALFGVHKKLTSSLSVECQVQELIGMATNDRLLCVMYNGWQGWV
jgi:hypothetical protein